MRNTPSRGSNPESPLSRLSVHAPTEPLLLACGKPLGGKDTITRLRTVHNDEVLVKELTWATELEYVPSVYFDVVAVPVDDYQ